MKKLIFTYGTLKENKHNHHFLEREEVEYLGEAKLEGYGVYNLPYGFPAILPLVGGFVIGEVYLVGRETGLRIDSLEGYRVGSELTNMYNKVSVAVELESGEQLEVDVYVWNSKDVGELCVNGRWED